MKPPAHHVDPHARTPRTAATGHGYAGRHASPDQSTGHPDGFVARHDRDLFEHDTVVIPVSV